MVKQNGLAVLTKKYWISCLTTTGVILLLLPITLCLTLLFSVGGLVFSQWLGWTRLAWLVRQMVWRLETVWLNLLCATTSDEKGQKLLKPSANDVKILASMILAHMADIVIMTWS